jgi:hypothetical protein
MDGARFPGVPIEAQDCGSGRNAVKARGSAFGRGVWREQRGAASLRRSGPEGGGSTPMLRRRGTKTLLGWLCAAVVCGLTASPARADILAHFQSVAGSSGAFTWTYDATTAQGQGIEPGDYFEIVDFKGFNGGHSEPTGWTFLTSMNGPTPPGTIPTDNSQTQNLVWTYTGTTPLTGPLDLGQFSANSNLGGAGTGQLVAFSTQMAGTDAGTKLSNISSLAVPSESGSFAPVPEPATAAVMLLILPLAVAGRYVHKRHIRKSA